MRLKICDENIAAEEKLPPKTPDRSGVGVHYVDAWIKPLNTTLENGAKVVCKRRGIKITLLAGDRKGEGLLRRLVAGPDPRTMLRAALAEAAQAAGVGIVIEGGGVYLDEAQPG